MSLELDFWLRDRLILARFARFVVWVSGSVASWYVLVWGCNELVSLAQRNIVRQDLSVVRYQVLTVLKVVVLETGVVQVELVVVRVDLSVLATL